MFSLKSCFFTLSAAGL